MSICASTPSRFLFCTPQLDGESLSLGDRVLSCEGWTRRYYRAELITGLIYHLSSLPTLSCCPSLSLSSSMNCSGSRRCRKTLWVSASATWHLATPSLLLWRPTSNQVRNLGTEESCFFLFLCFFFFISTICKLSLEMLLAIRYSYNICMSSELNYQIFFCLLCCRSALLFFNYPIILCGNCSALFFLIFTFFQFPSWCQLNLSLATIVQTKTSSGGFFPPSIQMFSVICYSSEPTKVP